MTLVPTQGQRRDAGGGGVRAEVHCRMKPIFNAIVAPEADTAGLAPAHFQPNNFRLYDPEAKAWVPDSIDPNRVRVNYAPGHPSFANVGSGPILLDFEFADDVRRYSDAEVEKSIDAIAECCRIVREMHPGRRLIPYGLPLGVWPGRLDDSASLEAWRRANGRLKYGRGEKGIDGRAGVTDCFDATGPVCYWFGPDWADQTEAMIAEARRLEPEKPCYPWIWFRRHNTIGPEATRDKVIPADEWRAMVAFVLSFADGAVLFGDKRWDAESADRVRVAAAAGRDA